MSTAYKYAPGKSFEEKVTFLKHVLSPERTEGDVITKKSFFWAFLINLEF